MNVAWRRSRLRYIASEIQYSQCCYSFTISRERFRIGCIYLPRNSILPIFYLQLLMKRTTFSCFIDVMNMGWAMNTTEAAIAYLCIEQLFVLYFFPFIQKLLCPDEGQIKRENQCYQTAKFFLILQKEDDLLRLKQHQSNVLMMFYH